MTADININDYVYVQLTDLGKQIYDSYFFNFNRKYGVEIKAPELKMDKEGYSAFQIWDLMQIFGPEMRIGLNPTFKDNILQFRADTSARKGF